MTLREEILDLSRRFYDQAERQTFVPGETYIPASGKVIEADDLAGLIDSSLDMWLTMGRFGRRFESDLAKKFGLKFARATTSGSAANLLAFSALTSPNFPRRIHPESEVITVAAGFPTTVTPIIQNRCIPVFVDVSLETANVLADRLADAVTPKTRAIMLAHTLGNPFELDAVMAIAKQHDLFVIEDNCDAFGATYDGRLTGTFGDLATLSFYPAHHITTGEGGAVLTNRKSYNRLLESYRDWGRDCWCEPGKDNTCEKRFGWAMGDLPEGYDHKYIYTHLGYNLKMTDMQAALGCTQLAKVDRFIASRRENFETLKSRFLAEGFDEHFHLPQATPNSEPSWFGFLLTIRDQSPLKRNQAVQFLEAARIGTRLLFGGNLTRQPAFSQVEYRVSGGLEVTDKIASDSFWIGVWPGIGEAQIDHMVESFRLMVRTLP